MDQLAKLLAVTGFPSEEDIAAIDSNAAPTAAKETRHRVSGGIGAAVSTCNSVTFTRALAPASDSSTRNRRLHASTENSLQERG